MQRRDLCLGDLSLQHGIYEASRIPLWAGGWAGDPSQPKMGFDSCDAHSSLCLDKPLKQILKCLNAARSQRILGA